MQIKDHRVYLPNGAPVIYETLTWDVDEAHWKLKLRNGWTKMYGAKLVENVVQALARVVMSQACTRIAKSFKPVLSSHDEWTFLVKDDAHKHEALEYITQEMKRTPTWLPNIPLDAEASIGERYAK